jgi:hypothetical protein
MQLRMMTLFFDTVRKAEAEGTINETGSQLLRAFHGTFN